MKERIKKSYTAPEFELVQFKLFGDTMTGENADTANNDLLITSQETFVFDYEDEIE